MMLGLSAHKTACSRCRQLKRKCVFSTENRTSCDHCLRRGTECIQFDYVPPIIQQSCARCFKHHKKCIPSGIKACMRCVALDIEDQCRYPASISETMLPVDSDQVLSVPAIPSNFIPVDTAANTLKPTHWQLMQFSNTRLNDIMSLLDTPMKEHEDSVNWHMEDTDLLPTFEDWRLCFNFFTRNGTQVPRSAIFDAESVLQDYFNKPAPFRLILSCLFVFAMSRNREMAVSYFKRARKALLRTDYTPSVEMVITFSNLANFAGEFMNQPAIGKQFIKAGMEMILELQMHIDPDDLPELDHLSPRQKEERRRIFWALYWLYSLDLSESSNPIPIQVHGDKVKAPTAIYAPHLIFNNMNTFKPTSELWNLIGTTKQLYSDPPKSVSDLLFSENGSTLQNRLTLVHNAIPPQFLLHFENPAEISMEEQALFIQQIAAVQENVTIINNAYLTSISVLYRPTMFLTALPSHRPIYINNKTQAIITNAINKCMSAALRTVSLCTFFDTMVNENGGGGRMPVHCIRFCRGDFLKDLFEAYIVFWFVACRMDPVWLHLVQLGEECNSSELRNQMKSFVKKQSRVGDSGPIADAVEVMVEEMEMVVQTGRLVQVQNDMFDVVSGLELGMRIMSVGEGPGNEDSPVVEPLCHLGLLGMELGNKVRWKGKGEDSWRLFWKLWA